MLPFLFFILVLYIQYTRPLPDKKSTGLGIQYRVMCLIVANEVEENLEVSSRDKEQKTLALILIAISYP